MGSLVCYQVGTEDAETFALQLGGKVTPQDLLARPAYRAVVRLFIRGMLSRPFMLRTLPP